MMGFSFFIQYSDNITKCAQQNTEFIDTMQNPKHLKQNSTHYDGRVTAENWWYLSYVMLHFKFHADIGVHTSHRNYPSCIEYMASYYCCKLRTLNVCCKVTWSWHIHTRQHKNERKKEFCYVFVHAVTICFCAAVNRRLVKSKREMAAQWNKNVERTRVSELTCVTD